MAFAVAMILLPIGSMGVMAAQTPVNYFDENGNEQTLTSYTVLDSTFVRDNYDSYTHRLYLPEGDYVIDGHVTIEGEVRGASNDSIRIFIKDHSRLTINGNMAMRTSGSGTTISIYSESLGWRMGQMVVDARSTSKVAIGSESFFSGDIIIYNGKVTAISGGDLPGIGPDVDCRMKQYQLDLYINGGTVISIVVPD